MATAKLYRSDQERIDDLTMTIKNPNVVGSGFISFPPQQRFEKPLLVQPPTISHLEFPDEWHGVPPVPSAAAGTARPGGVVPQPGQAQPGPVSAAAAAGAPRPAGVIGGAAMQPRPSSAVPLSARPPAAVAHAHAAPQQQGQPRPAAQANGHAHGYVAAHAANGQRPAGALHPPGVGQVRPAVPGQHVAMRPAAPGQHMAPRPAAPGQHAAMRPAAPGQHMAPRPTAPGQHVAMRPAAPGQHPATQTYGQRPAAAAAGRPVATAAGPGTAGRAAPVAAVRPHAPTPFYGAPSHAAVPAARPAAPAPAPAPAAAAAAALSKSMAAKAAMDSDDDDDDDDDGKGGMTKAQKKRLRKKLREQGK